MLLSLSLLSFYLIIIDILSSNLSREARAKQSAPETDELAQKMAQRQERIKKVDWNNLQSSLKNNKEE